MDQARSGPRAREGRQVPFRNEQPVGDHPDEIQPPLIRSLQEREERGARHDGDPGLVHGDRIERTTLHREQDLAEDIPRPEDVQDPL
jgi:hypothetical protein